MKPMSKLKHQIKSNKYYLFWGACTLAVMAGQIYVGTGYRNGVLSDLIEKPIATYSIQFTPKFIKFYFNCDDPCKIINTL